MILRSARRHTVRATCARAASIHPPGNTNGIKSIYPALKRLPLPGESDYRAKSTTRLRRQISADIEKPILHTAQMLFLFRRTTRAASHFTEHGAEFVDRAIGLQAYTVLLRTLAADKRRRAVVAASGI